MFFKVSTCNHELQHPLSQKIVFDNLVCQTDKGWHRHNNILYKGYCTTQSLDAKVHNKDFSSENGNYVILDFSQGFYLFYDNTRGFPLYYDHDTVHNLPHQNCQQQTLYHDGCIVYQNKQFAWMPATENRLIYNENMEIKTIDQCVDWLCDYLVTSASNLDFDLPYYACDSKGVDAISVQSAFDYIGKKYTKVDKNNNDYFMDFYYAYTQLYHGNFEPHVQLTGWCGDEYVLRNPLYCHWILQTRNIDLLHEFNEIDHCYMKGFFELNYLEKIKKDVQDFTNFEDAFNHVSNVAINDNQMWHYDEIITFTPFQNTQVLENMLYADTEAILCQVTDADISKRVIQKLNPKNLINISRDKNDTKPKLNLKYF